MSDGAFLRCDLKLDASESYSWCTCETCCATRVARAECVRFNRYDGNDVLELLNEFARDKPVPAIAFEIGEVMLANMSDGAWTRAQVLEWLGERWRHSAGKLAPR